MRCRVPELCICCAAQTFRQGSDFDFSDHLALAVMRDRCRLQAAKGRAEILLIVVAGSSSAVTCHKDAVTRMALTAFTWAMLGNKKALVLLESRAYMQTLVLLGMLLVPGAGIEPARLAARDFESRASTYSAIPATQAADYCRFHRADQALFLCAGKLFTAHCVDGALARGAGDGILQLDVGIGQLGR